MSKLFELKKFANYFDKLSLPSYRWDQFLKYYFSKELTDFPSWENFSTWSKDLKGKLSSKFSLNNIKSYHLTSDSKGRSYKALIEFHDGTAVETVLMTYKEYNTVCISSQIGCPLNCQFCASGAAGFTRNLTVIEILEQYQLWLKLLNSGEIKAKKQTVKNLVFMGMGEPFLNWANVKDAIDLFHEYYEMSYRNITVSTAGLVKEIRDFANQDWPVNLAISLHAARNQSRNILMPLNERIDLAKVWDAIIYYFSKHNRKVFLEYILIDEINDSIQEFEILIKKIKEINQKLLHINLIPYNDVDDKPWERSKPAQIQAIVDLLEKEHIHYTVRKSLGDNIEGACGQLSKKRYE